MFWADLGARDAWNDVYLLRIQKHAALQMKLKMSDRRAEKRKKTGKKTLLPSVKMPPPRKSKWRWVLQENKWNQGAAMLHFNKQNFWSFFGKQRLLSACFLSFFLPLLIDPLCMHSAGVHRAPLLHSTIFHSYPIILAPNHEHAYTPKTSSLLPLLNMTLFQKLQGK